MYTTTVRDELERYPVWPLGTTVQLGDIGIYDAKKKEFGWETRLSALGIDLKPTNPRNGSDDLYTSSKINSFSVGVTASSLGEATFQFGSKGSVVTQTTNLRIKEFSEQDLVQIVKSQIQAGKIRWDYRWRLVTRIYTPSTATVAVNISRNASLTLRTTATVGGLGWNIADASLGIAAAAGKGASWKNVAKSVQMVWFESHYFQCLEDGRIILHRG